jgi:hypothetical protein
VTLRQLLAQARPSRNPLHSRDRVPEGCPADGGMTHPAAAALLTILILNELVATHLPKWSNACYAERPATRAATPRRPLPSLKQLYHEYILQRIEDYKNGSGGMSC